MTPEWLEEIEKRDEYLWADTYHLLQACAAYRKAIEEAPHAKGCGLLEFNSFMSGYRDGMPYSEWTTGPCTCWKSKALSFNPTKQKEEAGER